MSLLHTWGSRGITRMSTWSFGGLSPDGSKWIAYPNPRYFSDREVLSALFRRLFLEMLVAAHHAAP
jgi:hypothetical protein